MQMISSRVFINHILITGLIFVGACHALAADDAEQSSKMKLGLWSQQALDSAASDYASDPKSNPAVPRMIELADKEMNDPLTSVMDKKATPKSGDKHDYMSISKYWWPDPSKPDGLPYIAKDGVVNPQNDIDAPDRANSEHMGKVVKDLSVAYYITGKKEYGDKAAEWVRTWFVDSKTRMNPNMEYAIAVPGRYDGHQNGCIEIHFLDELIDSVILLKEKGALTNEEFEAFRKWSDQMLNWLLTSHKGKTIAVGKQNISTWYDTEVIALALFTNHESDAKKEAEEAKERRIDSQIDPSGQLPEELKRTKSLGYSMFDLQAFCQLATLSKHAGVDLWKYEGPEGSSIRKSVDYHLPFLYKEKDWTYQQIERVTPGQFYDVVFETAGEFGADSYSKYLESDVDKTLPTNMAHLIFAKPQ